MLALLLQLVDANPVASVTVPNDVIELAGPRLADAASSPARVVLVGSYAKTASLPPCSGWQATPMMIEESRARAAASSVNDVS
jgi:hypothetical protein